MMNSSTHVAITADCRVDVDELDVAFTVLGTDIERLDLVDLALGLEMVGVECDRRALTPEILQQVRTLMMSRRAS